MVGFFDIIIIIFALFALSRAVLRFKDKIINYKELFFWLIVWILVIVLVFMKERLSFLTQFGVAQRPIDLIVYSAIIILFYALFRLYVKFEQIEQNITKIVKKVAIKNKMEDSDAKKDTQ